MQFRYLREDNLVLKYNLTFFSLLITVLQMPESVDSELILYPSVHSVLCHSAFQ